MAVIVQLPTDIEQRLRDQRVDVEAEALEALLVELYRQDKITHFELSESLGLSRLEAEALLKRHHVLEDFPTDAHYAAGLARLLPTTPP